MFFGRLKWACAHKFSKELLARFFAPLVVGLLSALLAHAAPVSPRIVLDSRLVSELNRSLEAYEAVRQGLIQAQTGRSPSSEQEERIDIRVHDLVRQLEKARLSLPRLAKPHEGRHLRLLLEAAQKSFEEAEGAYGEERRKRLESGINDMVNIVRIYRVDPAYSIFFCENGNRSWVQRGRAAQNPFETNAQNRSCGRRVE